mgnify:CR=1 FL=1
MIDLQIKTINRSKNLSHLIRLNSFEVETILIDKSHWERYALFDNISRVRCLVCLATFVFSVDFFDVSRVLTTIDMTIMALFYLSSLEIIILKKNERF